jgi:hypothetical protein
MSAFAVGILVPWNDPTLIAAVSEGLPGAGRSPYVAAMTRLKVKALPSVVNAGIGESASEFRRSELTLQPLPSTLLVPVSSSVAPVFSSKSAIFIAMI